ncbi:kelch repeat-containing protein [Haliangium ochraceum]|uniref:Integrin alpha beta-propellor repeat protein n=1 Tax=Haliangium ochraceum (strain DSM 14365 / JCM 11303 / SMP-2) TaxID=502025 RepID=D0LHP0_HALO1|nr:kelch repeat-containing protein [Haliangium ochraceum]ACY12902.1 Integrin alpha beta-propellor repeat protein [Haliangium ochraceum DSM 14365]
MVTLFDCADAGRAPGASQSRNHSTPSQRRAGPPRALAQLGGALACFALLGCGGSNGTPDLDGGDGPDPQVDAGVDAEPMPQPDAGPPAGFDFPDFLGAASGASRNWFGFSVDADDGVIVVGAPFYDHFEDGEVVGPSVGAAYVFEQVGDMWLQTGHILPPDPSEDEYTSSMFGWSVAVEGDLIAVGAWNEDTGAQNGAVYLYQRGGGTWVFHDRLVPDAGDDQSQFGYALDIHSGRVAVGAPIVTDVDDNDPATFAYIFERQGQSWQATKLLPDEIPFDAWYGYSVSLTEDMLVVGAPGDKIRGDGAGTVYVFGLVNNTWQQIAQLDSLFNEARDHFGRSVAAEGDVIVIGADGGGDPTTLNTGAISIFVREQGTFGEETLIIPDDFSVGQGFGASVAMRDGVIIVGAHRDDERGVDAGAAYIYMQESDGTWIQYSKLYNPAGRSGDQFGAAVAISDTRAIVGARYDDDDGADSGSAYIFEKAPSP